MADRKLLILTYHFPPSAAAGSFRMLGFAEHLPRFGWQTVVVAPLGLPWEPTDEELLRRVPAETAVYHISFPEGWLGKLLRGFFAWKAWLPFASVRCCQAIRDHRPDVVLTSGPPHAIHLLGRHLHRWARLPWVADFRDPWVAGEPSLTRGAAGWEARAEPRVMREADVIVANTPAARELLCQAYPRWASKMTSITNGYDPEAFERNPNPPFSSSTIEIIHTGTIYANRSPNPFLEAVKDLGPAALAGRTIRVRFIGDVVCQEQQSQIENQIRGVANASISLEGPVPHKRSIRAMVAADLLLLLDTPGRRTGVPAKLYEYIGAGRPILALAELDSDVAWVLRESGVAHRIAPPLDVKLIGRALREFLQDPASARYGRCQPAEPRFTRKHLAGELAAVLDSCLEQRPRKVKVGGQSLREVAR